MKTKNKKLNLLLSYGILAIIMSFCLAGCSSENDKETETTSKEAPELQSQEPQSQGNQLGQGKTEFTFTVVDKDGNETSFQIHTDKKTVAEALLEHELIAGDEGEYGLYVKTVNGITADYDIDQTYWAFYVNGEYASAGVDSTDVTAGHTYSFKVEK